VRPLPPSSHGKPIDTFGQAAELDQELRRAIRGEVRFDRGSRALYATDASNYRQVPIGVVVPRDEDDVRAAVSVCRRFGAPILARGSGTSLAGQSCNVAVVVDFTKYMNRILEIDYEKRIARVQPGVILDTLRSRAEQKTLTFGPDLDAQPLQPGRHDREQLLRHPFPDSGKTVDNVHELRILLYDGTELTVGATPEAELEAIVREGGRRGEIYAGLRSIRDRYLAHIRAGFPQIPRRVSGYNLDQLLPEQGFHVARALVGTEGTCAIVLGATLRLIESPQHRVLVGLGYPDSFAAADHVPAILETSPIGLEGFEGGIIDGLNYKGAPNLDLLPPGRGILLAEYGSNDPAESRATAERLVQKLSGLPGAPATRIYTAAEAKPSGRSASLVPAWHRRYRARFPAGRAGTMPRCRPNGWGRISASCGICSTNTATRRRSTAISATAAFTCR
jgi:FAD/FMN-containing dehydrogenase